MGYADPDVLEYLENAAAQVKKLESAKGHRQKLQQEILRLEKQKNVIQKAISDETSMVTKKRRDELAQEYQKQLGEAEGELKKIREKKEAARSAGKRERTERETADLRQDISELEARLKDYMDEAKAPVFFGRAWFYHLFLPESIFDYLLILVITIVFAYLLPFVAMSSSSLGGFMQMLVYAGVGGVLFILYMLIHMKLCVRNKGFLDEVNAINASIRENRREIREIQAAIAADDSEEYYHLDDFNYEIAKAESVRDEIKRRCDDALNNFDMVTYKVIADEIAMGYEQQLTELEITIETREGDFDRVDKQFQTLNAKVVDEYAGMFGKENLDSNRIEEIKKLVIEKKLTNITEAVNLYNGNSF